MNIQDLVKDLETIEDYGMQQYWEDDYDGSCPCFSGTKKLDEGIVGVWGRCWRVSDNSQDLHIWGTIPEKDIKKIARLVKRSLDAQKWYNKYTIIYDEKDPNEL